MKYRPEIDGLRALAVLPVIFFHAGFEIFNGGYIGVDVFFVISGYLITTILIEDLENKKFSLIHFYERRARRILPTLFFVMLVCIPLAWIWMLPSQMEDFSQSLIAVSIFASNILFWLEDGYFVPSSEEKPLLHTWSLAVEEQYYVLFPIFLLLVWRFGRNRVFWMIVVMAIVSLFLCENSKLGWNHKLVAKFYLTPTRAWEILTGSLVSLIVHKNGLKKNNFFGLIGLLAIIFSIFVYDKDTPFPSAYTLVPIIGTTLIIIYGEKTTIVAKILSTKVFVGVGLISYSAYLWHQPLFAFAKIKILTQPSKLLMTFLIILSLALASLSWKYIEKPFRRPMFLNKKKIFMGSLIGIIFFIIIGFLGHLNNGFEGRYSKDEREFFNQINNRANSEYVVKIFNDLKMSDWLENKKKVFLIGDSYAQDLTNAIYESGLLEEISLSTRFIRSRCGNLYVSFFEKEKFINNRYRRGCKKVSYFKNPEVLRYLKSADEIWFTNAWKDWEIELIPISLKNLKETTNAKIRIFGKKDFPFFKPHKYLGMTSIERGLYEEPINPKSIILNERLKKLTEGYSFIDVQSLMCGGNIYKCKIFDQQGHIKTYDGGHLTKSGAKFYGNSIKSIVEEFIFDN